MILLLLLLQALLQQPTLQLILMLQPISERLPLMEYVKMQIVQVFQLLLEPQPLTALLGAMETLLQTQLSPLICRGITL